MSCLSAGDELLCKCYGLSVMWECSICGYFNEGFDDLCAKCGEGQAASSPGGELKPSQMQDKPVQAAESSAPQPAVSGVPPVSASPAKAASADRLLVAIIVVAAIAVCALAFVAFSRGQFPGQKQTNQAASIPGGSTAQLANPNDSSHFLRVENLDEELILVRKYKNRLARYTKELNQAWTALLGKQPQQVQPGQLAAESLAELEAFIEVGADLVFAYQAFEEYILENNEPHLNEAAVLMRSQFSAAFYLLIRTIADYRGCDITGVHEAYLLGDTVPSALEEVGWVAGQPFRDIWIDARYASRQIELDLAYEEYYLQLEARYEALEQIHHEFNNTLKQIPPTKVRAGILGKDAKALLAALDAYASAVEAFALEFEEYAATLTNLDSSDQLEHYLAMNRELAQEDHLFCFMEAYKMYVKDKDLVHPAYGNLAGHFEFVKQTWPRQEETYMAVYRQYEAEWLLYWRPDLID